MKFYLELSNNIETYRLQKDDSWRPIGERSIKETDFLTESSQEIMLKQKVDSTITIGDKTWKVNTSESMFGETDKLYYDAHVLRTNTPETPSKEQLISTIRNGNDAINNSLILNVYGKFELRNFAKVNLSIEDPTIVVRNETFGAGNEYVGEKAANHKSFIDDIYACTLENWLNHLKTGGTNMYSDTRATKSVGDILLDIEQFNKK